MTKSTDEYRKEAMADREADILRFAQNIINDFKLPFSERTLRVVSFNMTHKLSESGSCEISFAMPPYSVVIEYPMGMELPLAEKKREKKLANRSSFMDELKKL